MPYKLRDDRRHKFKKARYKINNWSEYNQALKNRGSIFLWLSDDVIKSWYENKINRRERGAPNKYSNIAIKTALTIKSVYSLPYRATEGLLVSIFNAMKLNLDVPDYTRMCRRAKTGSPLISVVGIMKQSLYFPRKDHNHSSLKISSGRSFLCL